MVKRSPNNWKLVSVELHAACTSCGSNISKVPKGKNRWNFSSEAAQSPESDKSFLEKMSLLDPKGNVLRPS
ncbi:hypothetical protein CEXT_272471 [Caerostris extrusa]|uniref:Uncharacterized protein n=1 Tax=Caerostris extrusa TaxID=172846 RepID=A0AAV4SZ28_CAEEX|nr:hypothetical protein CEXT_272471 [Caerostris extrusa]